MATTMPASRVLAFDAASHAYRLPDGSRVPSVTQILSATGVSVDFEELTGMSSRIGDAIEQKRAIGSALHADAWAYDDNDLAWETVHPDVAPYLQAWVAFRDAHPDLEPATRERIVYHPVLGYCGTLDGVFVRHADNRRYLVDLKTGDPDDAGARYQLAAYQLAYEQEYSHIHERWSVQLTPQHTTPYRVHPYRQASDFRVWQAIVTTYHASARRRTP